MRSVAWLLLLLLLFTLTGCMISEQEGERTHVNSPRPEEMTFHFHTPFNLALLFGRSALLLLPVSWVFANRGKGGLLVPVLLALVCATGAVWLFKIGWDKAFAYRIEVGSERLHVQVPTRPELDVSWDQILAIEVEGMARDTRLAPGHSFWSTEWEDLTITMSNDTTYDVDLRPLSVEQRGTLWRAIRIKAQLGDRISSASDVPR